MTPLSPIRRSTGADGVPQPPANASALRAETTTLNHNQGQAYCTRVLSVNPISGAVNSANYLETDIYHDGPGDVVNAGPRRPADDRLFRRCGLRHPPGLRQRERHAGHHRHGRAVRGHAI